MTSVKQVILISGWIDLAQNDERLDVYVSIDGFRAKASIAPADRPDLCLAYGTEAAHWGFDAVAVMPTVEMADRAHLAIVELVAGSRRIVCEQPGARGAELTFQSQAELYEIFFGALRSNPGARVLELGSRARSGTSRRNLFEGCEYVGMDIREGPKVDVVGDAHVLSTLVQGEFDFVFSVSVFEHLLMPWKVVVEMNKVMKNGALAYIQTHQSWPVHDAPWDFWRFSEYSWRGLFNNATGFEVVKVASFEPCNMYAVFANNNPTTKFGDARGYGGVSVVARKIGPARVDWPVEVGRIIDSLYPA